MSFLVYRNVSPLEQKVVFFLDYGAFDLFECCLQVKKPRKQHSHGIIPSREMVSGAVKLVGIPKQVCAPNVIASICHVTSYHFWSANKKIVMTSGGHGMY